MSARADLLAVGEALAEQARLVVVAEEEQTPQLRRELCAQGVELAGGARAAFEAASMADLDPAPVAAGLDQLAKRLIASGVANADGLSAVLEENGPAAALGYVAQMLEVAQHDVATGMAVQAGYIRLRDALTGLRRDFAAAETDTARRITQRIETALTDAEDAINQAKQDRGDDGGEGRAEG